MIVTMKAVPKASYGCFFGRTSEASFRQVDRAVARVGPDPKMGDPNLKFSPPWAHSLSLFHVGDAGCDGGVATSKDAGDDSWGCGARTDGLTTTVTSR